MSKFRLFASTALAASIAFAPTAMVTRAQTDCPTVGFSGLEAEDCTLLSDAFSGLSSLTSFGMDYTVAFSTTGTTSDIKLDVTGTGAIDVSSFAANDPSKYLLQLTVEAALTAAGQDQSGDVEVRVVDGIAYVRNGEEWVQLPVQQLLDQATNASGMGMGGSTTGSSALPAGVDPLGLLGAFTTLAGKIDQDEFLTWTAEDVDGGRAITLNINTAEILTALEDADVIDAIKAALGPSGESLSAAQITQITTLLRPTLEASTFAVTWTIDPESKEFVGFALDVEINVDQQLSAMAGSTSAVKVVLALDVTLKDVNGDVTVEPVEDAREVSTDSMMATATP